MLTGPVFLLQLYDRVLPTRSTDTLLSLTALMIAIYAAMGFIDRARTQILARTAAAFQDMADAVVFTAFRPSAAHSTDATDAAMRDVEAVRNLLGSPALAAVLDLPFTPVFVAAIFALHPDLGWLATAGAAVMIAITCLGHAAVSRADRRVGHEATLLAECAARSWTDLRGLGMVTAIEDTWRDLRHQARAEAVRVSDTVAGFSALLRAFRLFLQSALMAYGAWIVMRDGAAPGAMMAASILSGRALAPVDQLSAHWTTVVRATAAWRALRPHLGSQGPGRDGPGPCADHGASTSAHPGDLVIHGLETALPGRPDPGRSVLSFSVAGGQALAVVGPSGAGKSTLVRVLAGAVPPAAGSVHFRELPVQSFVGGTDASDLPLTGYLPQDIALLPGTLAQNIARFCRAPDMAAVTRAARLAGIHDTIIRLPDGYGTRIGPNDRGLSGGQVRRLALARALYGEPLLLVLDEPAAHMDQLGCDAIRAAIRSVKARGGVAVVTGHALATLSDCEVTLVLDGAGAASFGPTDIMRQRLTGQTAPPARPSNMARPAR